MRQVCCISLEPQQSQDAMHPYMVRMVQYTMKVDK